MRSIYPVFLVLLFPLLSIAADQTLTPQELRQSVIDSHERAVARNQNSTNVTRAEYHQDPSTPNGIIFRHFLLSVLDLTETSRDDAVHNIVDRFNFSHDQGTLEVAGSLYDIFVSAADALELEIRDMENEMICSEARLPRTKGETYVIFTRVDDRREEIAENHFGNIRTRLSYNEYSLLRNHLDELQLSFYYRTLNHAAFYAQMPEVDIRERVEKICAERFYILN